MFNYFSQDQVRVTYMDIFSVRKMVVFILEGKRPVSVTKLGHCKIKVPVLGLGGLRNSALQWPG